MKGEYRTMPLVLKNSNTDNSDGSIRSKDNSSEAVHEQSKTPKTAFAMNNDKEVVGDNPNEVMRQFDPCKFNRKNCKYCDLYGNCMAENCLFDEEETAPLTKQFYTECIICHQKFSVDPKEMKSYICKSCLDRIHAREVLPFTCVHCGKQQNHPAVIPFSGICDECFSHELFNNDYTVRNHTYLRKDTGTTPTTDSKLI